MTAPLNRRDAGFTLVEALVSLFVFALLSAGCVLMLTQSIRAQERVGFAQASLRDVQMTQALLGADLAQIAQRPTRTEGQTIEPPFSGGSEAALLSFVRAAADADAASGAVTQLVHVSYIVRDGAVIRRTRAALDPRADAPVNERVLLRGVEDVRVSFFNGSVWTDTWLGATSLPRAVGLEATSPRYGRLRINALVSPP